MSRKSSMELLEYTKLTLRLIEQYPHREEDAHLALELKSALQRYIVELERETVSPARSQRIFRSPQPTENA